MVSLELVLDFLADNGIRATYKAVGEATGIFYRNLRSEPQFIGADPRTAWVVLAKTGQPPPEIHRPRPWNTELIRDGDDLSRRAAGARRGVPDDLPALVTAGSPGVAREAGAKDLTLLFWLIAGFLALFLFLGG